MYFGIDQLTALYPRCFFRPSHLRRPLKSDIRYDLIAGTLKFLLSELRAR